MISLPGSVQTKYLVIRSPHKKCKLDGLGLKINNTPLTRIGSDCIETSTKFLGVNLDETLSWTPHISHIARKVSRTLFAIKQMKHILPLDSLKTLYTALIHPHLSYGILAWGNANKSILKPLESLQKTSHQNHKQSALQ